MTFPEVERKEHLEPEGDKRCNHWGNIFVHLGESQSHRFSFQVQESKHGWYVHDTSFFFIMSKLRTPMDNFSLMATYCHEGLWFSLTFIPLAVPFWQPMPRIRPADVLWACSKPQHQFWKKFTSVQNWHLVLVCFFPPRLSKYESVIKSNGKHFSFSQSVKTSKSTFMTFHIAFFYVALKGHRILMSLGSIIFICHTLLSQYNNLTVN